MSHPNKFTSAQASWAFVLAGKSTFTVRSLATDTRFTYRVRQKDEGKVFFVQVLTGSDNEASYSYIGFIRQGAFRHGGVRAKAGPSAPSVKAFAWVSDRLNQGRIPDNIEIWHEGRCGRCNRKLTVPSSIESGLGPECARRGPYYAEAV